MAQEGFLYEANAYNALQKYGISTGGIAGASSDKPDLTVKRDSKTTGVELKLSPTAAGSLVMKYSDGKWDYGDVKGDPEKVFLKALGENFNLLKEMNTSGTAGVKWRGKVPYLQNEPLSGRKKIVGAATKQEAYQKDLAQFGAQSEIHINIPASAICDYYIKKKCSYINVGTHGFYTLNGQDTLGLNASLAKMKKPAIPNFAVNASAKIRVRCQYKGGGDYQFVMTLQFGTVTKSQYNLAPLLGTSSIDVNKLDKDPLIKAFI